MYWPLCAVGTCTCKSDLEEVGRSIVSSCAHMASSMVSSVADLDTWLVQWLVQ